MEKNRAINQPVTHSLTNPAYLMPWEQKLSLWNISGVQALQPYGTLHQTSPSMAGPGTACYAH